MQSMSALEISDSPAVLLNNSAVNIVSLGIHCERERVTYGTAAGGVLQEVAMSKTQVVTRTVFKPES